jgi:uncharacterized cupin superfamily protein
MAGRVKRPLGDLFGLRNFGVNLTCLHPGGLSALHHRHSRQDEFIYVLQGTLELETNAGTEVLHAGMCAGFPAGSGNAHRFVNRSAEDVLLLVIGDRTPSEEVTYPDIDLELRQEGDGPFRYFHKDGTPY